MKFLWSIIILSINLQSFQESLSATQPPGDTSEYIKALWYDANGNWDEAHKLIQDINDTNASWIHAYLHRKEGDISNADYWYSKAGKNRPSVSSEMEWEQIANALLWKILLIRWIKFDFYWIYLIN